MGDYFLNTTTNTLYGPKTATGWPATGTALGGASGGGVQVFQCNAGAANTLTITNTTTRFVFCNFQGNAANTNGTTVNLVYPAATTYADGVVIKFNTVNAPGGINPSVLQFSSNGSSMLYTSTGARNVTNLVTITSSLLNGSFNVLAYGGAWYQTY